MLGSLSSCPAPVPVLALSMTLIHDLEVPAIGKEEDIRKDLFILLKIYFICMGVLLACMSADHVSAWCCSWKPEGSLGSPTTGVSDGREPPCVAHMHTGFLCVALAAWVLAPWTILASY